MSATEGKRNICFSRSCPSLNWAQNLKVNIKSIQDSFTFTFGSPLQTVFTHYQFQLYSWTVFCEADVIPLQTARQADFLQHKLLSGEVLGNTWAKSCCKIKTQHYLLRNILQASDPLDFSWHSYLCSVLRQGLKWKQKQKSMAKQNQRMTQKSLCYPFILLH